MADCSHISSLILFCICVQLTDHFLSANHNAASHGSKVITSILVNNEILVIVVSLCEVRAEEGDENKLAKSSPYHLHDNNILYWSNTHSGTSVHAAADLQHMCSYNDCEHNFLSVVISQMSSNEPISQSEQTPDSHTVTTSPTH